jgi:NADH dehydrogenase/NADH:ubiquinone oxidoreductase subunit G
MGALTSKPYAFTARPWELRTVESVDFFDSFGSSIRIDTRGLKVMRVLPRINESLNEEWITDKIRFAYDGFHRQRLIAPLRNLVGQFRKLTWSEAYFELFSTYLQKVGAKPLYFNLFVGRFVDSISFYAIRSLVLRLLQISQNLRGTGAYISPSRFLNVISLESAAAKLPTLFRSSYTVQPIADMVNANALLILNTNLRVESPLLNVRLRRAVMQRNIPVYTLGLCADLTYSSNSLGNNLDYLVAVAEGRHPLVRFVSKLDKVSAFYSVNVLKFGNMFLLLDKLKDLARQSTSGLKVSTNLVFSNISSVTMADYGLLGSGSANASASRTYSNFVWVMDNDEVCFSTDYLNNDDTFTVYSGHHGDRNALKAALVLPFAAPFEKPVSFANMFGTSLNVFSPALAPVGNSTTELSFSHTFASYLFSFFNGKSKHHYKDVLRSNANVRLQLGYLRSTNIQSQYKPIELVYSATDVPLLNCADISSTYINSDFITSNNESYYLDNSIARASTTMALSHSRFQRYLVNFR